MSDPSGVPLTIVRPSSRTSTPPQDYDRLHTALDLLAEIYRFERGEIPRFDYFRWSLTTKALLDALGYEWPKDAA